MYELKNLYCFENIALSGKTYFEYHKDLESIAKVHFSEYGSLENKKLKITGPMTVKNVDEINKTYFDLMGFFVSEIEETNTLLKNSKTKFNFDSLEVNASEFKYAVIVDSDQYAGNFERELTSFLTGAKHECDIGKFQSSEFFEDCRDGIVPIPVFDELQDKQIKVQSYEFGDVWCNVCSLNDKVLCSGTAIFFNKKPSDLLMKFFYERSKEFHYKEQDVKIKNIYLLDNSETKIAKTNYKLMEL